MFKRVLAAVFIWLAAATVVWAEAPRPITDPAGWFSVIPPAGWAVSMVQTQRESTVRCELADRRAHLAITARPLPKGSRWADWEQKFRANLAASLIEPKFGPYRLCGRSALAVVGQAKDRPEMTVERIAGHGPGVVFVITMVYPTADWTEFRPILERTLTGFRCRSDK